MVAAPQALYNVYNAPKRHVQHLFYGLPKYLLAQAFQLVDHALDNAEPALPEGWIARVETERREQFGMMLGAARREHGEIALGEALGGVLVDRVERVHQAIAEGVGIDVEGRMDEVRDIGPEGFVAG